MRIAGHGREGSIARLERNQHATPPSKNQIKTLPPSPVLYIFPISPSRAKRKTFYLCNNLIEPRRGDRLRHFHKKIISHSNFSWCFHSFTPPRGRTLISKIYTYPQPLSLYAFTRHLNPLFPVERIFFPRSKSTLQKPSEKHPPPKSKNKTHTLSLSETPNSKKSGKQKKNLGSCGLLWFVVGGLVSTSLQLIHGIETWGILNAPPLRFFLNAGFAGRLKKHTLSLGCCRL